jgi:cellulose synthase/poly-beta-1,6-N-acetylglucosamine synthase-like glycosyltransferase
VTTVLPVSVIMPVRNEERDLAESVSSVLSQDYAGPLELVLAVGPSKDKTLAIAERLAGLDSRVTVVANPSGQIPSALNAAIGAAKHDVLLRVDGHALLPPGYIATAVRTLEETGAVNVGGIMAAEGTTPFQRAVAWAMTSPAGVGSAKYHTGGQPGPAESVYLGTYRRSALDGVGGWDENYLRAEDWELNHRIRAAGGLIWFQPEMRVSYRPRATLSALGSQYFHYGRWRHVVARMHAGTINLRYLAPPTVVAALLVGAVAGLAGLLALAVGAGGLWPYVLIAGFAAPLLYLLGVLAVTASAAKALSARSLLALPIVLATMHVCWGVGFLTSPRHLVPGLGGSNRAPAPARKGAAA